jgi:hypothetical protein
MAGQPAFYAELHKRIQDLIVRGKKVANAKAGTPAARIHRWIRDAVECLSRLEDETALSDFRHIQQSQGRFTPPFEFKVDDDDKADCSRSAYRHDEADVLLDFRFDQLAKANDILKSAATKLEMEGHSLPTLGQELRIARARAGHSQREAGKQIGYDHKYISEWERGDRSSPRRLYAGEHGRACEGSRTA